MCLEGVYSVGFMVVMIVFLVKMVKVDGVVIIDEVLVF